MRRFKLTDDERATKNPSTAAQRQNGVRPLKVKPTVTVPRVPVVYTDIPTVTQELDDKTGRYRYAVDHDSLEAIASTHASFDQMAKVFNIPTTVLELDPVYREIIDRARAMSLINLQSAQFKAAIEDRNPTMQIWLGKQHLGQKDVLQSQQLGADGKPITPNSAPQFVVAMPSNGRDLDPSRQLPSTAKVVADATGAIVVPQESA